ncbi:hypothetical protein [Texcoconibacillus texcoconensis]|uniref:Cation transport ATPase n=1 Tax=Texcoconibacillus texcoconensis TaxID=1095777 RepID=A0A840QM38_9BACI|nr:hypothetical protein [Texcoconibacillus texcoconensis]MBB5172434.1 cation transport ATPase [Texcoconibacillus texcoconensis]
MVFNIHYVRLTYYAMVIGVIVSILYTNLVMNVQYRKVVESWNLGHDSFTNTYLLTGFLTIPALVVAILLFSYVAKVLIRKFKRKAHYMIAPTVIVAVLLFNIWATYFSRGNSPAGASVNQQPFWQLYFETYQTLTILFWVVLASSIVTYFIHTRTKPKENN